MYMAPVTRTVSAPSRPALRRTVGLTVLLLAALVMLPWLLINLMMLSARFGVQAVDYAGQVALGR